MAIAASSVTPTNSLEDFRIEFNNLVSDVTGITATNKFTENIIFEGATADAYETTLTVTDPTADRTVTLPNLTGTVSLITATETLTNKTLTAPTINGVVGGTKTSATITTFTTTTVNASGVITGSTVEATGDTAADDNAAIGYTAAEGLILTGQGSTNDVTIKNDADADVITIATGGTAVDVVGALTAATVTSDAGVAGTTGTFSTAVVPDAADGATLGSASLEWSDIYLADGGIIYFGVDQDVKLTHLPDSGLQLKHTGTSDNKPIQLTIQTGETDIQADDVLGQISFQAPDEGTGTDAILVAAAIRARSEGDFSASSNATTLDFMTAASDSATATMTLSSGGNLDVTGDVTGATLNADGDTASGDNAAIGYTSAEGLILTGQGSTNDVTIKNDADGDVISIPTGTTNVTIAGDLTISGDDLYMGTNTSGAALIADGTNYNPVVISGDATIATNGALTIASTSVEGSMLNNNVISGLTALTSGLATTDELMVSDAGTLKRMDVSVIADLVAGDATALAIALG